MRERERNEWMNMGEIYSEELAYVIMDTEKTRPRRAVGVMNTL